MSILVNKDSKVIVQGVTGFEGQFHSVQMLEYGTNIVAGVTPGKGGQSTLDGKVPVFNSVEDAVKDTYADTSIIFVPSAKSITLAIAKECNTCFKYKLSISFLESTFILEFHCL